jgi:hypothetical protein
MATRRKSEPEPTFFSNYSLAEQIEQARPVAYDLIEEGIDTIERVNDDADLLDRVLRILAGDRSNPTQFVGRLGEEDRATVAEIAQVARAVGLALGLMLRPEAFRGGAR